MPAEITADPRAAVVAAGFHRVVLDVLLGIGSGEVGEALAPCGNRVQRFYDRRDQLFMGLHVDHSGHRQPTRLLKIAHALLGSRAEISIDRDGKKPLSVRNSWTGWAGIFLAPRSTGPLKSISSFTRFGTYAPSRNVVGNIFSLPGALISARHNTMN